MRELVLDKIEVLRISPDGFVRPTGRWSKLYLVLDEGLVYFQRMKNKQLKARNAIPLHETTREDFETLGDVELLECLIMMIRIASKQM